MNRPFIIRTGWFALAAVAAAAADAPKVFTAQDGQFDSFPRGRARSGPRRSNRIAGTWPSSRWMAAADSAPAFHSRGRWVKGADLYEKTVARTRAAMAFGALEGMLLHRGESDSNRPQDAETYEAGLVQMFEDFRQDVGSPDLPIIVGQLGTFVHASRVKVVMAAIRRLPDDLAAVGAAHSARLEHKGDHVHCDAASQHEFGRRYADAMLKLKEAGAPPGSAPCEDTFGMWPILAFHRSTIPRNPPR